MALSPPGWLMSYWGNLLIVGGVPEVAHSAQYPEHPIIASLEDVSMHDTWFVIEAVLYGDRNTPCVVDVARYPYKSLPALKVNCFGDRCRFHSNKDPRAGEPWDETAIYEPVTVPNKEELDLVRQYPCILPFLVGLPWLCRRVFNAPHEPEGASRGGLLPSFISNRALSSVHSSLRQHGSQLIGTAGPEVEPKQPSNIEEIQPANTLILVHVFGEPIRMEHLKIFNLFVEIADLDNWWKPGVGFKTFNRNLFRKFWDDWKSKKDVHGVDLTDVPSPYAWLDKPRQEEKFIEGFAHWEAFLEETVTDVFFDNVFRGGRANPWAGGTRNYDDYFDPLN